MRTLHGMLVHGFPNLFLVSQSQGAWTANYTQLLDEAATHLAQCGGGALGIEAELDSEPTDGAFGTALPLHQAEDERADDAHDDDAEDRRRQAGAETQ